MKKSIILSVILGIASVSLVSCSKKDEFIGSWQAVTPTDITKELPAAATASSLISISFGPDNNGEGDVFLSSLIDVTQGLDETPEILSPYEVSVAATASIQGKWMFEDDDDLILVFDNNSFNVDVDKNGVTFRQNVLTGNQSPASDSLTTATAEIWKSQLSKAM